MTRSRTDGERYRRSPSLILHWAPSGPQCFAAGRRISVTGDVVVILNALTQWSAVSDLQQLFPELESAGEIRRLLETLANLDLLERLGARQAPHPWASWSPEAAFFHFGTRDGRYDGDVLAYDDVLRDKALRTPPPPPTKTIPGKRVTLTRATIQGELADTLRARRTWRRFSDKAVTLQDLSVILDLTWGVQRTGTVRGQGPIVQKTSPSGGARHPIEAYLLVRNVEGLPRGVYHYDSARHALVDLRKRVSEERLAHLLAEQPYFARAGVVIVMTGVFARKMWRYPYSRAYRSLLIELGHFGQTFCLLSTALRLAPFCTMAFRDSAVDAAIGVDGTTESALYIVGVGGRAAGAETDPGRIPRRKPYGP